MDSTDWIEPTPTSVCDEFVDCCGCSDVPRMWAKAEYLYWHTRGMQLPPLVTTSTSDTLQADAGVLNSARTSILLGDERFGNNGVSGGRFQFGFWLDNCQDFGVDLLYTRLGDQSDSWSASSDQFPILARPFLDTSTNQQDSRLLGFPAVVSGNVVVDTSTEYQVFEALIRRTISADVLTPTSIVYGYRYAELNDSLSINDSSRSLAGVTSGSTVQTEDSFQSKNEFHGFEMGLLFEPLLWNDWRLSMAGKVAFGETSSTTTIAGQTISTTSAGASATSQGGLLTQDTNIGSFDSNSHGVLQDFSISLRRCLRPGLTLNIGYGIHRWVDVQRAGDQIDTSLNPTQISGGTLVGESRPEVLSAKSTFIAQGLTLGLEYYW